MRKVVKPKKDKPELARCQDGGELEKLRARCVSVSTKEVDLKSCYETQFHILDVFTKCLANPKNAYVATKVVQDYLENYLGLRFAEEEDRAVVRRLTVQLVKELHIGKTKPDKNRPPEERPPEKEPEKGDPDMMYA